MPTQSIATTTAKQHSHTGTSDVSAPPRRPLLGSIAPTFGAAAAMFGFAACKPGLYDANARGAALRRRRRRAKSK